MKDYTDGEVAGVVYEALRQLSVVQGESAAAHWDDVFTAFREQVTEQVRMLRSGYTPEEIHENWCDEMRENGWVHGPGFDAVKRTDPRLVKYFDLPADELKKRQLYRVIVLEMTVLCVSPAARMSPIPALLSRKLPVTAAGVPWTLATMMIRRMNLPFPWTETSVSVFSAIVTTVMAVLNLCGRE